VKRCALVVALAIAHAAWAQTAPDCPQPSDVQQRHLLGLWHAQFADHGPGATLLLEPHPEMDESVRGMVNRNGDRAQVAGDVDNGAFTLEESADGTSISATWVGDVVDGSCGREIRGTWQAEGNPRTRSFDLRKK
jgi:hypothetical protein